MMKNFVFFLLLQGSLIIAQKPKKEIPKSIDSLTQKC